MVNEINLEATRDQSLTIKKIKSISIIFMHIYVLPTYFEIRMIIYYIYSYLPVLPPLRSFPSTIQRIYLACPSVFGVWG